MGSQVAQEGEAAAGDDLGNRGRPIRVARCRPRCPQKAEKPGIDLAAMVRIGPGGHQVDADAVGAQFLGQVGGARIPARPRPRPSSRKSARPPVASKSSPTTEAPPSRPAATSSPSECLHQRLERVGRHPPRRSTTSPSPAANSRCLRQSGGANPMACSSPSRRSQRAARAAPAVASCSGEGDVDLEHLGFGGQLARRPPGEGESPPGAREDDLRALFLGQLGPRRRPGTRR